MDGDGRVPEPTELVPLPAPSWLPLTTALGITFLVVGLFLGAALSLIGGIVLVVSLVRWLRDVGNDLARLPREQHPASAAIRPWQ